MTALSRAAKIVLINIAVLVLLLMLAEGGASLLFVANALIRAPALSENSHATYDPSLGWVNRPNVRLPDQYGPGIYLRTNAQAFRNDHAFTRTVPPGKTRVVCSGDSFTFGFGVNNDQAWCQRLTALDPRLETVNMGQGGYGLDQAYLWYLRDGVALDNQVHLLAFITEDFRRMQSDRFIGVGKPILGLRNDSLVVLNQPVPKVPPMTRWMAVHHHVIGYLNVVRLGRKIFGLGEMDDSAPSSGAQDDSTRKVVARVFANVASVDRAKGSRLVLVYLPGPGDYRTNEQTNQWRRFVQAEAARQGIMLVDLIETIRRVPPTDVNGLFLQDGHYSVAGNEFIAGAIHRELSTLLDRSP
jgi:hypothetical protein